MMTTMRTRPCVCYQWQQVALGLESNRVGVPQSFRISHEAATYSQHENKITKLLTQKRNQKMNQSVKCNVSWCLGYYIIPLSFVAPQMLCLKIENKGHWHLLCDNLNLH